MLQLLSIEMFRPVLRRSLARPMRAAPLMRLSMRMQSTVPPPQRSNVNVKKWGLLVLGALAVGTTIYSVSNEKGEPKEFWKLRRELASKRSKLGQRLAKIRCL